MPLGAIGYGRAAHTRTRTKRKAHLDVERDNCMCFNSIPVGTVLVVHARSHHDGGGPGLNGDSLYSSDIPCVGTVPR